MLTPHMAMAMLALDVCNDQARREHAHAVAFARGIDPRLERFIPFRPTRRKRLIRAYDELLDSLVVISSCPEPDRTEWIRQAYLAAGVQ